MNVINFQDANCGRTPDRCQCQGNGHFFLFQRQQDKNTGRQLREDGSESSTCNIHMQQKDKYGIQYDVDNRTDQVVAIPSPGYPCAVMK